MAGRPLGYEYSYDFWVDDDIIPLHDERIRTLIRLGIKSSLFEIRTIFKLKTRVAAADDDDGETMRSETFGATHLLRFEDEDEDDEYQLLVETRMGLLEAYMSWRMKDYWMSDDEIQSFVLTAEDYAKQREAKGKYVTVVVELDVWRVQQEGEPIDETIDRAIRLERLFPLRLSLVNQWDRVSLDDEDAHLAPRKNFLRFLSRIRVEDEVGLAQMEVCY